jgi:hypothetical protein
MIKNRNVILTILLVLTAVVVFVLLLGARPMFYDDTYIHLRIAKNLAESGHPFFNLAEKIQSGSSLVWTLLLSLPFLLPWNVFISFALLQFFVLLVLTAGVNRLLLRHITVPRVAYFLSILIVFVTCFDAASRLMETPLALTLLVWALLLKDGMPTRSGVLMGLACFTRPEMVVAALIWGGYMLYKRRYRSVIAFVAVIIVFCVYQLVTYGSLIPHSVIAKSDAYNFNIVDTETGMVHTAVGLSLSPKYAIPLLILSFSYVSIRLFLCFVRKFGGQSAFSEENILGFFALAITIAYLARHVLFFQWYMPLISLPLLVWMFSTSGRIIPAAMVILMALSPLSTAAAIALGTPSISRDFLTEARVRAYLKVAGTVEDFCPSCRIVTSEIGAIGWQHHGEVLDGFGLASSRALTLKKIAKVRGLISYSSGEIAPGFIEENHPEIIITYEIFGRAAKEMGEMSAYRAILLPVYLKPDLDEITKRSGVINPELWGSKHLEVYVRRDREDLFEPIRNALLDAGGLQNLQDSMRRSP